MRRASVGAIIGSATCLLLGAVSAHAAGGLVGLDALRAGTGGQPMSESAELGVALADATPTLRHGLPTLRGLRAAPSETIMEREYQGAISSGTVAEAFGVDEPEPATETAPEPEPSQDPAAVTEDPADTEWVPPPPRRSIRVVYLDPALPLERAMRERPALAAVLLDPNARSIATQRMADGLLLVVVERDATARHAPIVWPRDIDPVRYGGIAVTGLGMDQAAKVDFAVPDDHMSEEVGAGATVVHPSFRVGANLVTVNGVAHRITVQAKRTADWQFTSNVSTEQRRAFRAIMRSGREPGARRIANELRPMVVVTMGNRKTDCTSEGYSCAGIHDGRYTITMHPGHLTTWGDGPLIVWHEFAHIAYFASKDTNRLDKATTKALKGRCIRSWQGPRDPSTPLPCTPPVEAFADNFAYWALHRDKADAGYLRKRYVAHPVMRRIAKSMHVHLA